MSIIKSLLFGAMIGAIAFFMPGVILFFLAIMLIGKIFFWGMWSGKMHMHHNQYRWAMADKIRTMSDDEYQQFREKYSSHCGHYSYGKEKEETSK